MTVQIIRGETKCRVADLVVGQRVDLEADIYADPTDGDALSEHPEFAFEFEVVATVERETDECVVVYFENGFACGFPTDHLVDVDGEQDLSSVTSTESAP